MKRMVLIPEERLLRYEERDKQRTEHRDDIIVVLDWHYGVFSTQCVDPTRRPRGAPNNEAHACIVPQA